MKRLRIALVVLVVPLVSLHAETSQAARVKPEPDTLVVTGGAGHAALLAQDTQFEPRLQLHSEVRIGLGIYAEQWFRVAAGLAVERANASALAAGYVYPAWTGKSVWVSIDCVRDASLLGFRIGASAVLAGYDSTFLVFFFPDVTVGPVIRMAVSAHTALTVDARVEYQFREDLAVAGSVVPGALLFGLFVELERAIAP